MAKVKAAAKLERTKYKAEEYSYSVVWSDDDKVFIGRVVEFPSLAAHGDTQEDALREIRTVIEFVLEDLTAEREEIARPLSRREFSGKLNVRMPKTLHRQLAAESGSYQQRDLL